MSQQCSSSAAQNGAEQQGEPEVQGEPEQKGEPVQIVQPTVRKSSRSRNPVAKFGRDLDPSASATENSRQQSMSASDVASVVHAGGISKMSAVARSYWKTLAKLSIIGATTMVNKIKV